MWGLFGSPRARFKLRGAARVAFEVLWFGAGVVLLYAAGQHAWALSLRVRVCAQQDTRRRLEPVTLTPPARPAAAGSPGTRPACPPTPGRAATGTGGRP
ncbi:DUF2568 domain-containing protein [Streptomyces sp. NPDC005483]|uniref:YrdB family protein n=1 Tax=Streptomyces sp. NPDC005483 TaxID=3154882 RepID=UPI0033BDBB52